MQFAEWGCCHRLHFSFFFLHQDKWVLSPMCNGTDAGFDVIPKFVQNFAGLVRFIKLCGWNSMLVILLLREASLEGFLLFTKRSKSNLSIKGRTITMSNLLRE